LENQQAAEAQNNPSSPVAPAPKNRQGMKILIVDDEEASTTLLENILRRGGYSQLTTLHDPRDVSAAFIEQQPDLLLLDLRMPHLNGFEVLAQLQPLVAGYFPVLVLTADANPEVRRQALAEGAKDFLTKPFDSTEVQLRVGNLLEARAFHLELQAHNAALEARVAERTAALEASQVEVLTRLARIAEYRDEETGEHVWRVAQTAALLARELGVSKAQVELLLRAARLHDVGKVAIPDGILLKPYSLTPEEFEVIKTHTTVGAKLLSGGHSPLLKMAQVIALTHHERWDGSGYPQGLAAEQIPLEGRILAVADTFDALTHDRIYRRAWAAPAAVAKIISLRGKQFDPQVVDAFLDLYERGEITAATGE
jgi:putative two-component system response regulator